MYLSVSFLFLFPHSTSLQEAESVRTRVVLDIVEGK